MRTKKQATNDKLNKIVWVKQVAIKLVKAIETSIFTRKFIFSSEEGRGEEKTFTFKIHVFSELKIGLRKHQKKALKKLVKANKGATFAPATTHTFIQILASKRNQTENLFSKKDFKKLVTLENGCYICTPQNTQSSLID